jgi:hypothetical protein
MIDSPSSESPRAEPHRWLSDLAVGQPVLITMGGGGRSRRRGDRWRRLVHVHLERRPLVRGRVLLLQVGSGRQRCLDGRSLASGFAPSDGTVRRSESVTQLVDPLAAPIVVRTVGELGTRRQAHGASVSWWKGGLRRNPGWDLKRSPHEASFRSERGRSRRGVGHVAHDIPDDATVTAAERSLSRVHRARINGGLLGAFIRVLREESGGAR